MRNKFAAGIVEHFIFRELFWLGSHRLMVDLRVRRKGMCVIREMNPYYLCYTERKWKYGFLRENCMFNMKKNVVHWNGYFDASNTVYVQSIQSWRIYCNILIGTVRMHICHSYYYYYSGHMYDVWHPLWSSVQFLPPPPSPQPPPCSWKKTVHVAWTENEPE